MKRTCGFGFVIVCVALLLLAPAALAGEVYGPLPIDVSDVSWLAQYIDFVAVGVCIVVGLLWKHCTALDNKYIPLIVVLVGLAVSVWTNVSTGITAATVLGGMFSGLVSVGFHQVFKQLFE